MKYIKNSYTVDNVHLNKIVKKYQTPIYCYSKKILLNNIRNFKKNFKIFSPLICFATKANSNIEILKEIKKNGLGADVVSQGELMKALKAGINPKKIVFSGVGKTKSELVYAIDKKILLINAESESEILQIEKIAKSKNRIVDIGIRLNPNTDARTLAQISTGKKENKFGINEKTFIKIFNYLKNSKNINLKCLSVHIGSQIMSHKPYEKMLKVIDKLLDKLKFNFKYLDLGGGMGIPYNNEKKLDYKKYNIALKKFKKKNKSKIIFEPGRSIIGNAGVLITKVIYIKKTRTKDFIILDAGMNDLLRPALYGAEHRIIPVNKENKISKKKYEFVGPICETTDKFLSAKKFQKLNEGDYLIICDTGAYGASLSSNYNVRPKPIEILINKSKINVIKKQQKLKDLI